MNYLVKVFNTADREWVVHKKEFTDKVLADNYAEKMYNKYNKDHPGRYDTEVVETTVKQAKKNDKL